MRWLFSSLFTVEVFNYGQKRCCLSNICVTPTCLRKLVKGSHQDLQVFYNRFCTMQSNPLGILLVCHMKNFFCLVVLKKNAKKIGIPSFAEYILLRASNISITN